MLPVSLPRSVTGLLDRFRGCFTAPTFTTFCGLACGFWAQPGLHTVTGMLIGARLEQAWHHARAHRFFSGARWSADQLGLVLLDLILAVLVPSGVPVRLVADDTLMRRSGRKVFGTGWHHDPLAPGRHRIAWANNWVVLGVLVDLPFVPHRPVCLPILARLWQPKHTPGRLDLAVELVKLVCGHLGQRRVDLLVAGAYAGRQLRDLPRQVTVTCRLRADARLHRLAPPHRLGTRGRPRTKGDRLPELTTIAGLQATPFALHQTTCYGHNGIAAIAGLRACGRRCSPPALCRSCWSATRPRPTASTWRWSPPTFRPPPPSWWNATRAGGRWRCASARPARTPASAKPATAPAAPWSAPCRSGWSATAW